MKYLKTNPIKFIIIAVFTLLALTSCVPQKAYGAVPVARSAVSVSQPSVSVPKANKATVEQPRANTKGMVNQTATAVLLSQMLPTVCTDKGKDKNRCVRK